MLKDCIRKAFRFTISQYLADNKLQQLLSATYDISVAIGETSFEIELIYIGNWKVAKFMDAACVKRARYIFFTYLHVEYTLEVATSILWSPYKCIYYLFSH